jgi:2-polyprenyl-3-methyl-5-hydroxy-6-metoxy-1,4-benzoquinol methylase
VQTDDSLLTGHYAQKQIFSPSRLVAWSHRQRFRTARTLVAPFAGRPLLDYGCGDGTFLAIVHDLFPEALGVDAAKDQVADCARRFAQVAGLSFAPPDRLSSAAGRGHFGVVVCMEVLEHCPDDSQNRVLDDIAGAAAPQALVLFSVPIEIGPALVAKQSARALVALRGLSEYASRERYRPGEMARMVFARADTAIPREEYVVERDEAVMRYTGHKGFNWRTLQRSIEKRFALDRRLFSPMPYMGPWLNSQVWFVCRNR